MPTVDFGTGFECRSTADLQLYGEVFFAGSAGFGTIDTVSQRSGARCWRANQASGSSLGWRSLPQRATRVMGAACIPQSGSQRALMVLGDADVAQIWLRLETDRTLTVLRSGGSSGTPTAAATLATSGANALSIAQLDVWNHFEIKATCHDSTGTVAVYVNSNPTPWINATGLDTKATANAWFDSIWIYGPASSGGYFDDVYTADDRMAFPDQKFLPLNMSAGNGTLTGSTPSSGTDRGAMVDETTQDGDTTYNIFDNGETDSYNAPTLGSTSAIRYFILWGTARKSDYGPVGMKTGLRLSSTSPPTNYLGTERFLGSGTYDHWREHWNVSPATAVAFTEAEINAAEFVASRTT